MKTGDRQGHGGDVYSQNVRIDFSINLNPLGMPEEVRQAAIDGVNHAQQYPDVTCRTLRCAVARQEQVPEDQIIFGNGAAELIFQIAQALRPRQALLVTPGFAEYERALEACGTKVTYYACSPENDFAIGEDFLKMITKQIDLIYLCNPNNPTGISIPDALLRKIITLCRRTGTVIVIDECFAGLWEQGEMRSVKPLLERNNHLFILRAFTKLYGMAGLRLGYGLSSNAGLLKRMEEISQPWNISIPAQQAGTAAMTLESFRQETVKVVSAELQFLKEGFRSLGLKTWASEANFLFFAGPTDLKERCLAQGILIRNCDNYRGLTSGYFRVAVRCHEDNEELLRVLQSVLL